MGVFSRIKSLRTEGKLSEEGMSEAVKQRRRWQRRERVKEGIRDRSHGIRVVRFWNLDIIEDDEWQRWPQEQDCCECSTFEKVHGRKEIWCGGGGSCNGQQIWIEYMTGWVLGSEVSIFRGFFQDRDWVVNLKKDQPLLNRRVADSQVLEIGFGPSSADFGSNWSDLSFS